MRIPIAVAAVVLSLTGIAEGQVASDKYLLLATERTATMQQEIDDAAARGFRVFGASPNDGSEAVFLLEQTQERYQYRLLAATRSGTLQKEINEAADDGYRIVPRAVSRKGDELLVLMEKRSADSAKAQYRLLATERTGTLQKEISSAARDGYALIALAKTGEHIAILERDDP